MTTLRPVRISCFLLLCLLGGGVWRAADALELPKSITLSPADQREISERKTLRGRPLVRRTDQSETGVWDGLQVFTGRKDDVIRWFRSGQQGLVGVRLGPQEWVSGRTFQYEMLCSELLRTGDLDIIRAILWSGQPDLLCYTGYTTPDWRGLLKDKRLTTAERMIAWWRVHAPKYTWPRDEFWKLFGGEFTADAILDLVAGGEMPLWEALQRWPGDKVIPVEKAKGVLLPLIRREYLSVRNGDLVHGVLRCLWSLYEPKDMTFLNMLLDKLEEWDQLGDERSIVVWDSVFDQLSYYSDDKAASRLRELYRSAKVPPNAGRAFWGFSRTAAGRAIQGKESARLQPLFDDYLAAAGGRKGEQERLRVLLALAGWYSKPGTTEGFRPWGSFELLVSDMKHGTVQLSVTPQQHALLVRAWGGVWQGMPEALALLKVAPPQVPK